MTRRHPVATAALALLAGLAAILQCRAEDWPMWGFDPGRTHASPQELPDSLQLQWVLELPPREPIWEEPVNRDRMPIDLCYEPVAAGRTLFLVSDRDDTILALDTRTGAGKWRAFADGPIRLPPVVHGGRLAAVADDGMLHILDAETGKLLSRIRGGPDARKVLGNGHLISAWPVRGGPVVDADGTLYFAAGIWPFMGVFIHAVDLAEGRIMRTNDATGSLYTGQPHGGADAFGGPAPQGNLALAGNRLLVPGGRSVPACFDRETLDLQYFHLDGSPPHESDQGVDRKIEGGAIVAAKGMFAFNRRAMATALYNTDTGGSYVMWKEDCAPVITGDGFYLSGAEVRHFAFADLRKEEFTVKTKDKATGETVETVRTRYRFKERHAVKADATGTLIRAGRRLYAGGRDAITVLDLAADGTPSVREVIPVTGLVLRLIAADDRLFAVTAEGRICAFAGENGPGTVMKPGLAGPEAARPIPVLEGLIERLPVDRGLCFIWGMTSAAAAETVLARTDLDVVGVAPDEATCDRLRRLFLGRGLYGSRIRIAAGTAAEFRAPPYMAVLTWVEDVDPRNADEVGAIFRTMRPYGGVARFPGSRRELEASMRKAGCPGAITEDTPGGILVVRHGALPGAADWTHLYGDAANSAKSDDRLARPPFGLLWFGGNTHDDILPRHGHGPSEQVCDGRLFIQGVNRISARDVYTGRVLWKRDFEDLGTFGIYYDKSYNEDPTDTTYNQVHIVGANARGTNVITTPEAVYVAAGRECLALDPATGKTLRTLRLPPTEGGKETPEWGYLGFAEGRLLAGTGFAAMTSRAPAEKGGDKGSPDAKPLPDAYDTTCSRGIAVLDPATGAALWNVQADHAFRHNAIAAGGGRVFCIDALPDAVLGRLARRGLKPENPATLSAYDLNTGELRWRTDRDVFGTWLAYSKTHNLLVQSGRPSRDMLADEPGDRIIVFRADTGEVLWDRTLSYTGPLMLHGSTIYLNNTGGSAGAVELLTGHPLETLHPITLEPLPWTYHRRYGCNSATAAEFMLTYRSGAAGFYDLQAGCGTANLGGFKSGCSTNLIAANGVLNAPDYTRTCTCSYQNQTSLGLIHMPDVEAWSATEIPDAAGKVRALGLNFGAPGDSKSQTGTVWFDFPAVGGPSPELPVTPTPANCATFRRHSSAFSGELPAVAASGLIGIDTLTIGLHLAGKDEKARDEAAGDEAAGPAASRPYTVRLVFAEPEEKIQSRRRFHVLVDGKPLLESFCPGEEAKGGRLGLVREFPGLMLTDPVTVRFVPAYDGALPPVISGIEILAE